MKRKGAKGSNQSIISGNVFHQPLPEARVRYYRRGQRIQDTLLYIVYNYLVLYYTVAHFLVLQQANFRSDAKIFPTNHLLLILPSLQVTQLSRKTEECRCLQSPPPLDLPLVSYTGLFVVLAECFTISPRLYMSFKKKSKLNKERVVFKCQFFCF